MSVQALSGGSTGGVTGQGPFNRPREVALHPALKEEWRVVFDLNVGIVEALKLKQPVLVALFIARSLGEATASEKARAIRTAHAQLKELKAMEGKGGFAELANWVIPSPGHGSVWGASPG